MALPRDSSSRIFAARDATSPAVSTAATNRAIRLSTSLRSRARVVCRSCASSRSVKATTCSPASASVVSKRCAPGVGRSCGNSSRSKIARDCFALGRLRIDADDRRQQFVAAHPDERPNALERHTPAAFAERPRPGTRMRVVAVDQRTVDVEDDRLHWCRGRIGIQWHGEDRERGSMVILRGTGAAAAQHEHKDQAAQNGYHKRPQTTETRREESKHGCRGARSLPTACHRVPVAGGGRRENWTEPKKPLSRVVWR